MEITKRVETFLCGMRHFVVHTESGVYTFGDNESGQLGIPIKDTYEYENKLEFNKILEGFRIDQIACHQSNHTVVITSENRIFGWGLNDNCQIIPSDEDCITAPTEIKFFDTIHVDFVSVGSYMTFFVTKDKILVIGWNGYGSCCIGKNEMVDIKVPTKVGLKREGLEEISAGQCHVIFLYNGGREVHGGGNNEDGCLGLGHKKNCYTPRRITFFEEKKSKVVSVSCGWGNHTFFVTNNGCVYACGSRIHTGLSRNEDSTKVLDPTELVKLRGKGIIRVEATKYGGCLLTKKQEFWFVGKQIANNKSGPMLPTMFRAKCDYIDIRQTSDNLLYFLRKDGKMVEVNLELKDGILISQKEEKMMQIDRIIIRNNVSKMIQYFRKKMLSNTKYLNIRLKLTF